MRHATAKPPMNRLRQAKMMLRRGVFHRRPPQRPAWRRAVTCSTSETGDTMIEVVIATLLVGLIAAATFTGFAAVSHISGAQRHQEQAAQLAQQDEARLRGLSATELSAHASGACSASVTTVGLYGNACYAEAIDNETYTVTSSSKFVSASSGAVSCTGSTSADYIETSSTVTWRNNNDGRPPVIEHSLVSPPLGGGLIVQVNDGSGNGLAGVSIAITGPTDPGAISSTQTLQTDSDGCAVFAGLAGGTYQVTYTDAGYIMLNGTALPYTAPAETIVPGQTETLTPLQIGNPGAVVAAFATSVNEGAPQAISWDSFSIADFSNNAVAPTPQTFSAGTPSLNVSSGATVFPATYSAYAGTCVADDPGGSTGTTGLTGSTYIDPDVTVPAGATGTTVTVVVPTMLLQPTLNYTTAPGTTTYNDDLNSSNPANDTTDAQLSYTSGSTTVTYTGAWNYSGANYTGGSNPGTGGGAGDFNHDETWSNSAGATVSITFTGTSVTWLTPLAANHGYFEYSTNNGLTYSAMQSDYRSPEQYQDAAYSSGTLPYGTHTLTIKVFGPSQEPAGSSGAYVSNDGFTVGNTGGTTTTTVTSSTLPYTIRTYDSCPTPVARTVTAPVTAQTVGAQTVYPVQAPYGTSVQVCFANSVTGTNTGALPSGLPQIGNTNLNGTSVTALALPVASGATGTAAVFSSAGSCP
jgi:type II secretory pathway pseudopilin PulG